MDHKAPARHAPQAAPRHVQRLLRILVCGLAFSVVACGGPPPPPDPDPDPEPSGRVAITSPAHGSSVSGAVYFAAQLLDPADIASLELRVAGERVRHEFPGETPLRVFLIPRDHPEGPLQLSASVGSGASRETVGITVNVVHEPPASATVGAGGAILGGQEADGSISTVSIPAGVARGASVSFETMTQAEVLTATGVDYDALGVTFLGAQEIRSTIPTGDEVAMTSGGFGPMVQPGQMVVSYRILPDAGRGTGELMVINGAAVAPNGDIVSNRPVVPRVAEGSSTSALGTFQAAALYRPSSALPAGPPGTALEFSVSGLNIYAVHGYLLRFKRGAQVVDVPTVVGLNGDGRQYLLGTVPQLPAGAAVVEVVAVNGDLVIASHTMNVTASPSVADPKALVDAAQAQLLAIIADAQAELAGHGMSLDFGPLTAAVEAARSYWAGRPADDPELVAHARMLAGGGIGTSSLGAGAGPVRPSQSSTPCLLNAGKYTFDRAFAARAFKGDRFETGLRGLQANLSLGYLDRFADRLQDTEYDCDPYKEILCEEYGIGDGCGDQEIPSPPDDDSPNDPLPRPPDNPDGPRDWITGMGSIVPPGGSLGGSGGSGGGSGNAAGPWGPSPAQQSIAWPYERGRFTVRVLVGNQPWPFATEIGPDGYFFLPAIPYATPAQLVITDMHTFQECTTTVTGRPVGSANAVYIDLPNCLEGDPIDPDDYSIVWVGAQNPGSWNQAANWDPPRLPNEDDDVLIPASSQTVLMPAGAVAVRSLDSRGTLRMSSQGTQLSAEGDITLNWLYMSGTVATVEAGGEFRYRSLQLATPYTLPGSITSLEKLQLDPFGHLYVDHELEITESLVLGYGGTLRGTGRTVLMPSASGGTGGVVGQYGGGSVADSHTLEIRSTFESLSEGVSLSVVGNGTLHIAPTGTLRLASPGYVNLDGSSPNGVHNEGLILVATPRLSFPGCLHNHGTVRIAAGSELYKPSGGCGASHNHGTIEGEGVFAWEHITAAYQDYQHHAGATIDVDTLRLMATANPITLEGSVRARELEFGRGGFILDQDIEVERLFLHRPTLASNVVLTSSGTITVSELLSIGAGTLGGTGSTVLGEEGVLEWQTGTNHTITGGHTLVHHGTSTWEPSASGQITIAAGSTLRNHGDFIVQNDRPVAGGGIFHNFGLLTKTTAGASTWNVCYDEEPGGEYLPDPGTIAFTGVCPP